MSQAREFVIAARLFAPRMRRFHACALAGCIAGSLMTLPVQAATCPAAIADAAAAARLVRQNAERWGVDPERVGMLGFSADQ